MLRRVTSFFSRSNTDDHSHSNLEHSDAELRPLTEMKRPQQKKANAITKFSLAVKTPIGFLKTMYWFSGWAELMYRGIQALILLAMTPPSAFTNSTNSSVNPTPSPDPDPNRLDFCYKGFEDCMNPVNGTTPPSNNNPTSLVEFLLEEHFGRPMWAHCLGFLFAFYPTIASFVAHKVVYIFHLFDHSKHADHHHHVHGDNGVKEESQPHSDVNGSNGSSDDIFLNASDYTSTPTPQKIESLSCTNKTIACGEQIHETTEQAGELDGFLEIGLQACGVTNPPVWAQAVSRVSTTTIGYFVAKPEVRNFTDVIERKNNTI